MFRAVVLAATCCVLLPRAAAQQRDDGRAGSAERGHRALESGQYSAAIAAYREAYSASADPRLLYNLALAHLKRHRAEADAADLRRAEDLFRRFRARVGPSDPRYRAQAHTVRRVRALARGYLAEIATLKRKQPASASSRPAAARPTSASARPRVEGSPAAREDLTAEEAHPPAASSRWHWWLYGLAAGCAVAAAISGGVALSEEDAARARFDAGDRSSDESARRATDLALATDVLLGVAAAGLITAGVLHYLAAKRGRRRDHDRAAVRVILGPASGVTYAW